MGTFESTKITGLIALFDLLDHCLDVRGRALVPAGFVQRPQLGLHRPVPLPPHLPQGLTNPFGQSHAVRAGGLLERPVLFVIEKNLQSLSHEYEFN